MQETSAIPAMTGASWVLILLLALVGVFVIHRLVSRQWTTTLFSKNAGMNAFALLLLVCVSVGGIRTYRESSQRGASEAPAIVNGGALEQAAIACLPQPSVGNSQSVSELNTASPVEPGNVVSLVQPGDFEVLPPGYFGLKTLTGGGQQLILVGDWCESTEHSSEFVAGEDKKLRVRLLKILAAAYERQKEELIALHDQHVGEPPLQPFAIERRDAQVLNEYRLPPPDALRQLSIRSETYHKPIVVGDDQPITANVSRLVWVVDVQPEVLQLLAERTKNAVSSANVQRIETRYLTVVFAFIALSSLMWFAGAMLRRAPGGGAVP